MSENCGNCRFAKMYTDGAECRRYPPTKHFDLSSCGPTVRFRDWCGEWAAVKQAGDDLGLDKIPFDVVGFGPAFEKFVDMRVERAIKNLKTKGCV